MNTSLTAGAIGALGLLACAAGADAALYQWDWDRGDPGHYGLNDNGGTFESVSATFHTATREFSWSVTFSDQVTEGFTLAVNDGPNPKGHAGELALLYVDARDHSNTMITAYAYNGKNSRDSFKDGDGQTSGLQPADFISEADRSSFIIDASVVDHDGKRTISFSLSAADVNTHSPAYPSGDDDWFGIGFGEQLGLWMHPYRNFDPTYGPTGAITSLSASGGGWFDGRDFTTIPAPGAAAFGAVGLLAGLRRRRA